MTPDQREGLIVAEAVRFFAEYGFDGNTRDLAKRLGITQPLLFRYFPTKDALIERAYQEVFPQRWSAEWDVVLADTRLSLRQRLIAFYVDYAQKFLTYESVRLFLFARLSSNPLFRPHLKASRDRVSTRVVDKMVEALYIENGLKPPSAGSASVSDLEIAWSFQESVMYYGIRCMVHGLSPAKDLEKLIETKVDAFLDGANALIRRRARARTATKTATKAAKTTKAKAPAARTRATSKRTKTTRR